MASVPLNTELLARPEADQLMHGLNSGNITVEHLVHQLNNPGVNHRQRDLLLSVLKVRSLGPRAGLPQGLPPNHQQGQLPNHGQQQAVGSQGGLPPPLAPQMTRVSPVPQQPDPMMLLAQVLYQILFLGISLLTSYSLTSSRAGQVLPPGFHLSCSLPLAISVFLQRLRYIVHLTFAALEVIFIYNPTQAARVPSPQEMTMLTQHIMQQVVFSSHSFHVPLTTPSPRL